MRDSESRIPIRCTNINAFVCKLENGISKYLIIRRSSKSYTGSWQMVSVGVEKNVAGWEAAIREIKEETGLIPTRLYSSNIVESVYLANQNYISMVPVCLAFVDPNCEVVLNEMEHDEYKWITIDDAENYLMFDNEIESLRKIEDRFIKKESNKYLEIDITTIRV